MRQRIANLGSLVLGTTLGGAVVGLLEGRYRSVDLAYAAMLYAFTWAVVGSALAVVWVALGVRLRRRRLLGAGPTTWGALIATAGSALGLVPYVVRRELLQDEVSGWWAALSAGVGAAVISGVVTLVVGRALTPRRAVPSGRGWLAPLLAVLVFAAAILAQRDPRGLGAPPGCEGLTAHHAIRALVGLEDPAGPTPPLAPARPAGPGLTMHLR